MNATLTYLDRPDDLEAVVETTFKALVVAIRALGFMFEFDLLDTFLAVLSGLL